jgi:hypothetical protein
VGDGEGEGSGDVVVPVPEPAVDVSVPSPLPESLQAAIFKLKEKISIAHKIFIFIPLSQKIRVRI